MAPKPRLLDECLRGAWDALNEHAPLRRCVLGITLLLTIVCISFSAFGVGSAAPSHGAYSPRLFAILFLPAELYLYDLFLGATVRTGAAMFLDMRLPLVLWAALRLALMGLGGMAAVILPGVFVLGMFKGAAGASVFIAIGLVAIIWITLMVVATGFSVRFMFLPIVVALRTPSPIITLYHATKGMTWRLARALFLPYGALIAVSIGMELVGPALERRLGFVALAPWFLVDACLTAFISCASAVLLALVYRRIVAPLAQTEGRGAAQAGAQPEQ